MLPNRSAILKKMSSQTDIMEVRVRHLSDKNQSIVCRMGTINRAVNENHPSLEKEATVIPQQAASQIKTRLPLFELVPNSVTVTTKDISRHLNGIQNPFVHEPLLGRFWRQD